MNIEQILTSSLGVREKETAIREKLKPKKEMINNGNSILRDNRYAKD